MLEDLLSMSGGEDGAGGVVARVGGRATAGGNSSGSGGLAEGSGSLGLWAAEMLANRLCNQGNYFFIPCYPIFLLHSVYLRSLRGKTTYPVNQYNELPEVKKTYVSVAYKCGNIL